MEINQDLNKPVEDNSIEVKVEETNMEQRPPRPEPPLAEDIPATQPSESEHACPSNEDAPVHPHCHHGKGFMFCHALMGVLMVVAVVVLYILHFTSTPHSKVNPNATAPVVAEGNLKIAYINTDTLMEKYQYAIDLRKENEQYQKQLESQFTQEANSLQSSYEKLQKDFQSFTQNDYKNMTLAQQKAKEEDLKKRESDIQNQMQKLQNRQAEYATKAQEKLLKDSEKMQNAIYAFIREYNQANQQFDLILAKSQISTPVLYGNPGMEITDEIVAGLNKEYADIQKK